MVGGPEDLVEASREADANQYLGRTSGFRTRDPHQR
jgi:hypothetical protein